MACKVSGAVSLYLLLMLGLMSSWCEAEKVAAMYVFGDSLVDVGNNNYLKNSFDKANFPHNGIDYPGGKPTGRFSNGKNTADFLAEKVGLPTSPPPYLSLSNDSKAFVTGVSFASGGARILSATQVVFQESISLTEQVDYYSVVYKGVVQQLGSAGALQHLSNSLFAIVIGSNDLLGHFSSKSNLPNTSTPPVDQIILTLKEMLKRMHDLGARKFVVTGIGMIGCCPTQRYQNKTGVGECNEEANQWSLKYNEGLKPMLEGLKSELKDISYSYFDAYTAFLNFIQKPATYGFKEVQSACCGMGFLNAELPCIPTSSYCSNRSDHLFWDLYHPTEAAARIFVDLISVD
ncbi:GDSL esterase/lipase At5g55050-like [Cornus florida]|uniref:GDSL esterase/lipase At5g55050-like n=1 Tax=Cornus florida TaxID=4283 RepID=UPI002896B846|nr:GDSL esterase/lipase At5g55050-like [Cornus florida]